MYCIQGVDAKRQHRRGGVIEVKMVVLVSFTYLSCDNNEQILVGENANNSRIFIVLLQTIANITVVLHISLEYQSFTTFILHQFHYLVWSLSLVEKYPKKTHGNDENF